MTELTLGNRETDRVHDLNFGLSADRITPITRPRSRQMCFYVLLCEKRNEDGIDTLSLRVRSMHLIFFIWHDPSDPLDFDFSTNGFLSEEKRSLKNLSLNRAHSSADDNASENEVEKQTCKTGKVYENQNSDKIK